MKNIQFLTLMMMMMMVATMGYAASIHRKDTLLEEIHQVAKNLAEKMTSDVEVPVISTDHNPGCVAEFFCLAEKSLNSTTGPPNVHALYKRLNHLLHQCNKGMGHVTCSLNTTATYSLKILLSEIMRCSTRCKRCLTA